MESYTAPWPVFVFIGVMFSIVIWWFVAVSKFFTYMASNHLAEYKEMGSPTLFANNTPRNNISFLRFILGNSYKKLDDPTLNKMCGFLKKFFYSYSSVFLLLVIGLIAIGNS